MNDMNMPFPTTPETVQPQWVDHLPVEMPKVEEPKVETKTEMKDKTDGQSNEVK